MTPRSAWSARLRGRLGRDHDQREVTKSDDAWREQLSPEQYRILRRRGTEAAFTGHDPAVDAGGLPVCGLRRSVPADAKFDSGTGWPSFSRSAPDGVELHRDFSLGFPRTEVLRRRCGGHLGHVFNDGPTPERKRYCINAGALAPGERSRHPTTEEAV